MNDLSVDPNTLFVKEGRQPKLKLSEISIMNDTVKNNISLSNKAIDDAKNILPKNTHKVTLHNYAHASVFIDSEVSEGGAIRCWYSIQIFGSIN